MTKELDLVTELASIEYGDRFEADEARGIRSPHTGRFTSHQDYGSDEFLNVSFNWEDVYSKTETHKNGGKPSYVRQAFITIQAPNDKLTTIHTPVTDFYEWRFPYEWEAFKNGDEIALRGTPIEQWSELQPTQIKELKFNGIHTVEQIAQLNDSHAGRLRTFFSLKAKAQKFVDSLKVDEKTKELNAELAKRDAEMAEMKAKLDALLAMMEKTTKTKS